MIHQICGDRSWKQVLTGALVIGGAIASPDSALAQITPDDTLGAEGSRVRPNATVQGGPAELIEGGAVRNANLFHSFQEFNVEEQQRVYFDNPPGIDNIFSRVTGGNPSNILGTLGVDGQANLFLLNPNGILFGANASLDVQGSFLATTADAVKLGDAGLFSASQPTMSNLLTVSPSALWFNAVAAQPIVNRSQAQSLIGQRNSAGLNPGLQVPDGRTLALVGGDVLLEGGRLTAAGGRIELGSVTGMGQVSLTQSGNGFVLRYDLMNNLGNISLSNEAIVDASGEGGGDVQIRGGRLEMAQSSNIWADTLGAENGGELLVRVTDVELSETSFLKADVFGTGTGGDVRIGTRRLLVRGGSQVGTGTRGEGNAGSLLINASDLIEVIGTSADGRLPSGLFAPSAGTGSAGDLRINTRRLLVRDGAQVLAGTYGSGNGGSLLITASESIEVIGTSANGQVSSALSAQSQGSGDAGNLRIDTGRLLVQDGAQIATSTRAEGNGGSLLITASESVELTGTTTDGRIPSGLFTQSQGNGDAGDILRIDTGRLLVQDGAQVAATTFGEGKGGSLVITASDSVEVIGTSADNQFSSGLFTASRGSGDAGDILRIDTGRLLVQDGAAISSNSTQEGIAGNIDIEARDTLQANNGTIRTNSTQTQGGAITIRAGNIRLFGDSDIRSNVAFGENNGGTITLTADSILAFDDSDILAFALDGRGGDITLDTPAFFGENYRSAPEGIDPDTFDGNGRVDINASGAIAGVVSVPDLSFIQNSLSELPQVPVDPDQLLANSCIARSDDRGSFTVTGAGGLPTRPGTAASPFPTGTVQPIPQERSVDASNSEPGDEYRWQPGEPIVEPQGVYQLPNGRLVMSRECS